MGMGDGGGNEHIPSANEHRFLGAVASRPTASSKKDKWAVGGGPGLVQTIAMGHDRRGNGSFGET